MHHLTSLQFVSLGALLILIAGVFTAAAIKYYFIEKRRHIKRVISLAQGDE